MAGLPVTSRRRGGVVDITAAVWTAGFHWWHSGNITRTQNVSEYILVLAVYLVFSLRSRKVDYTGYPSASANYAFLSCCRPIMFLLLVLRAHRDERKVKLEARNSW